MPRIPLSGSQAKRRRMFFEALESRSMMAQLVGADTPSLADGFENYLPPSTYLAPEENALLTSPVTGDPVQIARNYLRNNGGLYGLNAYDVDAAVVTSSYSTELTGVHHVYFQQRWNGLPVQGGVANVNVTRDGEVLAAGASFVRNLHLVYPGLIEPAVPQLDALGAFSYFASLDGAVPEVQSVEFNSQNPNLDPQQSQTIELKEGDITSDVRAHLEYTPRPDGSLQLSWNFEYRTLNGWHYYDASVAADGPSLGSVVQVYDLVKNATYNVFPLPVETPQDGVRAILTDPNDLVASPFGWHDLNGVAGPELFVTQGNNADVFFTNLAGVQLVANGGAGLNFNFPLDLTLQPLNNVEAVTTNVFYIVNTMHDLTFRYGFDEAAGNFQFLNYSGQGVGGDSLNVNAADIVNLDNAFMLTLPDGQVSDLNMGIFTSTLPFRYSGLDAQTVIHEFSHGVTDRLTGGPADVLALLTVQSYGMAEGWSDFFAILSTLKATDTKDTPMYVGAYLDGNSDATGPGFRRNPYAFNKTINPITLNDFNGGFPNNEVHNTGEIWASALIDMMWLLIDKYGFDPNLATGTGGNNLAFRLVMDALKLQPASPTFMQARDAIIAADRALTGGANYDLIWAAMARRGFGRHATSGINSTSPVVIAAFDTPRSPGKVTGVVYQDTNGNHDRNTGEPAIAGVTVFFDKDQDGVLDAGEQRTTTRSDGSYELTTFANSAQKVRAVVPTGLRQTEPFPNLSYSVVIAPGLLYANYDFGLQDAPGEIHGTKWLDSNGDGVRDPGEPGLGNIWIYVDVDNDGKRAAGEPAAVTAADGTFTIKEVRPGTYTVRESLTAGYLPTFPVGTMGGPNGVHTGVVVTRNTITPLIDFGNQAAFDYGDAPAPYPTLNPNRISTLGAVHSIIPGFGLGAATDAEANGLPSSSALGDDTDPSGTMVDDEDGVRFLNITAGANGAAGSGTVEVTVRTNGLSPGVLVAWVDFNGNGSWEDPGEKIINDRVLGAGVHLIDFVVPAGSVLGTTFSRFRYSYDRNRTPFGLALGGEVEDHQVNLLDTKPVARPDSFPDAQFGDPLIQSGAMNVVLDVLRNDLGVAAQLTPTINTFDTVTTGQGTITLGTGANAGKLLYTPIDGYIGVDTFTYDVIAGGIVSNRATVTITVIAGNPVALDNTYSVLSNSSANSLPVLANDLPRTGISILNFTQPTYPTGTVLTGNTVTQVGNNLQFTPPAGFTGTVQFQYTIQDAIPLTANSTATVTVQVLPALNTPAATHLAGLQAVLLDANKNPLAAGANINVGDTFFVALIGQDLRGGGTDANRGLQSAFADLLYESTLAEVAFFPPGTPNLPAGTGSTKIEFNTALPPGRPNYDTQQTVRANRPAGLYDESGAVSSISPGLGQKLIYFAEFKATNPGVLQFVVDPADGIVNPVQTAVIVPGETGPDPVVLADNQVYLQSSVSVTINPAGAGEFTNFDNRLDVNGDGFVTGLDALLIVDDLNKYGPRFLDQLVFLYGQQVLHFLDVNVDAYVTGLDALLIVDELNRRLAAAGGGGEFLETAPTFAPEASGPLAGGDGEAPSTLAATGGGLAGTRASQPETADEGSASTAPPATPASSRPPARPIVARRPTNPDRDQSLRARLLDADSVDAAMDDLFSELSTALRRRRGR
jgi:hypothetical protein